MMEDSAGRDDTRHQPRVDAPKGSASSGTTGHVARDARPRAAGAAPIRGAQLPGQRTEPQPHVVYCRGCQHAWVSFQPTMAEMDAGTGPDDCACTCTDDTDPRYEDWVTDPDPAGIPEGAWA